LKNSTSSNFQNNKKNEVNNNNNEIFKNENFFILNGSNKSLGGKIPVNKLMSKNLEENNNNNSDNNINEKGKKIINENKILLNFLNF